MLFSLFEGLGFSQSALLICALGIVFAFEFVNGFHDTANAVATVIYTNALKPQVAVIWSGICNFLGVFLGGVAVAFAIVHLLPVDLLVDINTNAGLAMVFSLLVSAIVWNFGTWYLALPASSSHALIGSILGVGLANGFITDKPFGHGVNWGKAEEVGLSLLLYPVLGFVLAAALLLLAMRLIRRPELYTAPKGDAPPPGWVRAVLILTCTGVSFFHGSNDGQKGVGMVMLILIGLVPAQYALNLTYEPLQVQATADAAKELDKFLALTGPDITPRGRFAADIERILAGQTSFRGLNPQIRWSLRQAILRLDWAVRERMAAMGSDLERAERKRIDGLRGDLLDATEYAPLWVLAAVALSLGLGTMIGWKRIVVTVGEKIGKSHLTYAQGACAELVAMGTIGLAVFGGLPVSTTHVLSSAVAGTMAANKSGVRLDSVKKIALAWVLTLPATMLMAALLLCTFRLFTG